STGGGSSPNIAPSLQAPPPGTPFQQVVSIMPGNPDTQLGSTYQCTHGTNGTCGLTTLSSGSATVSTTAIGTLASATGGGYVVSLTEQNCTGTCTGVRVGSVTAG